MRNPWLRLGFDAWALGLEASGVVALRTLKLAAGGAEAQTEAEFMVDEKMRSFAILSARGMTGSLGLTPEKAARATLSHYRRKVRANRRRLAQGR